jgi:flagellar biosynthesis protein FliQ
MTEQLAIEIVRETLFTALVIAGPMLLSGLIVGVLISLLQSVTQVQEMTLTFIPKILTVVTVLILLSPWMLGIMFKFVNLIYGYIGQIS